MRRLALFVLVCGLSGTVRGQERVTLTLPTLVDAGVSTLRVESVVFNWRYALIRVRLTEWNAVTSQWGTHSVDVTYAEADATALMLALNKANLTTRSLHQRILDKLIADGKIQPGTVSGVVP